jgi:hypothetical protein
MFLTFMGPRILRIFQYVSNKMQRYTVYLYLENALHVSGGTSTIIRSANNCIYSIWYLSDRYCYLPLAARRGSRGVALLFHDHGTRRRMGVNVKPRPLFTPRKDPVPIVQEVGLAPGPAWTGAENLSSTGIRSPDRPARSHHML